MIHEAQEHIPALRLVMWAILVLGRGGIGRGVFCGQPRQFYFSYPDGVSVLY